MNKNDIRERYERFKDWQEQPHVYKLLSDQVHHCNNCGNDFTGNYCPICSQKAGMGRIGWRSVHQGVMDIWGLGTRSLLYSVWQLLWRPGHLISDYIDGKRQVSFPPVKMLFIIAVIYSMLYFWFIPDVLGISLAGDAGDDKKLGGYVTWLRNNYSWYALIMAVFAVFPTWVMFRYSPRHTQHSLPEGFFIQVFLAVIIIVLNLLIIPLELTNISYTSSISLLLYACYYIVVYKYVFGYGLWGTLWRSGFVLITILFLMTSGVFVAFNIDMKVFIQDIEITKEQAGVARYYIAAGSLIFAVMVLTVGFVIIFITHSVSPQHGTLERSNRQ